MLAIGLDSVRSKLLSSAHEQCPYNAVECGRGTGENCARQSTLEICRMQKALYRCRDDGDSGKEHQQSFKKRREPFSLRVPKGVRFVGRFRRPVKRHQGDTRCDKIDP